MKIEERPIDEVKPYEANPRINDAAVDAVAQSIKEFGWRQPIVVDANNVIICGHTRWKAAVKLGLEQVPVHVATDLTEVQVRAYRLADNKLAELAEWNMELLPIELADLQAMDFNMELLGFDADELAKLMTPDGAPGLTDPDEIPEPPDAAITQPGDLWILGNHRLLCGDSGKAEDVDRLVDGAVIDLVCSDPPYNVKVEPRSHNAVAAARANGNKSTFHHQGMDEAIHGKSHATHKKLRPKDRALANDFVTDEDFSTMLEAWFGNMARVLKPGGSFYIWGGYANIGNYPPPLKKAGLYFSQGIVWDKEHPVLTRKDMLGAFELCFYGWKEGAGHQWYGPNNIYDIWHVKKITQTQMEHLTQKPVELAVRPMQYSSKVGENVLDLFGGSGQTLIAAEQTGRHAFLMELDALYCDVIVDRFQRFSGTPAILARTGTSPLPMKPREEVMR